MTPQPDTSGIGFSDNSVDDSTGAAVDSLEVTTPANSADFEWLKCEARDRRPVPSIERWTGAIVQGFRVTSAVPEHFRSSSMPRPGMSAVPADFRSVSTPRVG